MQRLTIKRLVFFVVKERCFVKSKRFYFVYIIAILIVLFFNNVYIDKIIALPDDFYASYEEVEEINHKNEFGKLVKTELKQKDIATDCNKNGQVEVVFKLFGFLPIKKTSVKILPEEEVYVGGCPIGIEMKADGAVIVSNSMVLPEDSKVVKNQYLKNGDVITGVNGVEVHNIDDVAEILSTIQEENAKVTFLSCGQEKTIEMPLLKDENDFRLGVWVKDNYSGVGTLTFVQKDNLKFGALGHPITNGVNEDVLPISEGEVFSCSIVDIEKGERNKPGELRGVFVKKNKQGNFDKNTKVGIFGKLQSGENLFDLNRSAKLGGRLSVKSGSAKLVSSVSGILEEYDIEIIKTNFQSKSADKSMVIRVIDERLLALTGGIVQGMSGSPIIQNRKVVGAVTHVFLTDPTKGYAVYSDWMLEQMS